MNFYQQDCERSRERFMSEVRKSETRKTDTTNARDAVSLGEAFDHCHYSHPGIGGAYAEVGGHRYGIHRQLWQTVHHLTRDGIECGEFELPSKGWVLYEEYEC